MSRVARWVAACASLEAVGVCIGQTFDLVGIAPTSTVSRVYGLSDDGMVAGGGSLGNPQPGFTWTRAGGRYDFGFEPGMPQTSTGYGISGDGGTVVGRASNGQAYRWQGPGTFELIGNMPGYSRSYGLDANLNGSVVVGRSENSNGQFAQAFRWTPETGMVAMGFARPGQSYSSATAVSRDGSVVVGFSRASLTDAFIWTPTTGMQVLPSLPGGEGSSGAYGMNSTGSVIVGFSGAVSVASIWRNGVVEALGTPTGYAFSQAKATSEDGAVVVGDAFGSGGNWDTAYVWTLGRGAEPLAQYLAFHGVQVPSGVNLLTCTAVSSDGRTIAGFTQDSVDRPQQGFVVTIPTPGVGVAIILTAISGILRRASWSSARR